MTDEEYYGIVQLDETGLFTWVREKEKYEVSPFAKGVVTIFKGSFQYVADASEEFMDDQRGKKHSLLSPQEISDLVEE